MNLDTKTIYDWFVKNIFSMRGIAICITIACALFAYNMITSRVVPMAYGANAVGANPTDLMETALAIGTALISGLASHFLGISPEIIQAVVAYEKDKTNSDVQRRLGAAILGYIINILKQHPDGTGGFVLMLLYALVNAVDDPGTKEVLKAAASNLADKQFSPVPSVAPANKA
jgi:hypothetical protein